MSATTKCGKHLRGSVPLVWSTSGHHLNFREGRYIETLSKEIDFSQLITCAWWQSTVSQSPFCAQWSHQPSLLFRRHPHSSPQSPSAASCLQLLDILPTTHAGLTVRPGDRTASLILSAFATVMQRWTSQEGKSGDIEGNWIFPTRGESAEEDTSSPAQHFPYFRKTVWPGMQATCSGFSSQLSALAKLFPTMWILLPGLVQ